jgi:hypothetical protein
MQAHIIRSLGHTRYLMGKIGTRQDGMAEAFAIGRMVIPNGRTIQDAFSRSITITYE